MGLPLEKHDETFTYKNYRTWPEEERWELIHGIPYAMSPAPSPQHQFIVGKLFRQFDVFFDDKPCTPFVSPIDVLINTDSDQNEDDTDTIVQPDIIVVCDEKKITRQYIKGAPDLIVEVLSPSTAAKDIKQKFALYEEAGVKQYWLVYPYETNVIVFTIQENGTYGKPDMYTAEDVIESTLFEGLTIDLKPVFPETQ